jgi:hypothetical protein
MKKFALLLAVVLMTAISANVFAQAADSGTTPAQGSTHNYSVTANGSNTYAWSITIGDLTSDGSADVTFNPTSADGASVNITWSTTASTTQSYYLHVIETDETTGCTNEKVMKIDPIPSQFFLAISADYETDQCYYDGAVSISLDGSDLPVYDHGTATITYTITPSGTGSTSTGYTFNFGNAINDYVPAAATLPDDFSILSATVTSGDASISGFTTGTGGGTVTVNDNASVTVQFVIDHVKTYGNGVDAAVSQFTSVVNILNGVTANGVADNGNGTYSADFLVTRPHTSDIVTD